MREGEKRRRDRDREAGGGAEEGPELVYLCVFASPDLVREQTLFESHWFLFTSLVLFCDSYLSTRNTQATNAHVLTLLCSAC